MDTLSKLTHDSDEEVAYGAILGLGLIGAGIKFIIDGNEPIIHDTQEQIIRESRTCFED